MDYQSFQSSDQNFAQQTSQQIPPIRKTLTSKFIWLIVGLLVLGGVAYAGLWFWNDKNKEVVGPTFTPRSNDDMVSWKTYRNEQYGFEFKYPGDWRIDPFSSFGFDEGIAIRSSRSISEAYPYEASILIKYGNFETSRKAFEENILPNLREDIDYQIRDIQFSGKDAISYSDLGVIETEHIVISLGNRLIEITYLSDFDQILSTFKFIK